jgi:hypothetical protein
MDQIDRSYNNPGIMVPSKNGDISCFDIETDSALV